MNLQVAPGPRRVAQLEARPLIFLNNLDFGGAQVAVLNLAIGLRELGCTPIVAAWRRTGPLEERFRAAGIALELPGAEARGGWRRIGIPKLIQDMAAIHGSNVLHAHMSDSAIWAALVQKRAGIPAVVTHHTTDLIDTVGIGRPIYGWSRRRLLAIASRNVAANIAVSEAVRERLAAETGIGAGRVEVIENGLPLPPADRVAAAMARRAARPDGEGPVLVAVGRLTREKGFDTLIRALPAVAAAHPDARAVIVGDGPFRQDLVDIAVDTGVAARVAMPGFVHNVSTFLEQADLLAAPSLIEGLPMAVIEAMAWGLPVVASDIPGHRALIEPEVTGLSVPTGDPARLADAILRSLAEREATAARAARARDLAAARYSARAMAARHIELYRRLLDRR